MYILYICVCVYIYNICVYIYIYNIYVCIYIYIYNMYIYIYTVAPRYYANSDMTQSVVDPDFLLPGENAKWACLNLLRIALTIL